MPRNYVESVPSERVELDGKIYRRYPQSGRPHLRNYFSRSGSFYHVALWAKLRGAVPPGHQVHHRDGDPLNNDIANLECLPVKEHVAKHPGRGRGAEQLAHLDRIRGLTKAWHASPEGLVWHAENGRSAWDGRTAVDLTCCECGGAFTSLIAAAKFCSRSCGNKQWMRNHPEYNEQKKARAAARLQLDGSGGACLLRQRGANS